MRVLHIISSPAAGGAEMYVKDLAIAMRKRGLEVFILFISHASEIQRSADFERKFIREISSYGIGHDFIGNKCKKNPLKGIIKLQKVASQFSPTIIHSHLYYGAVFSLFIRRVKRIYTHHNIALGASKRIYKLLNIGMSAYVGICNACQELLLPLTHKRVTKITNGVDTNRIIRKKLGPSPKTKKILMAGRLTEQKNYHLILEVLGKFSDLDVKLLIAGEGPTRQELERYIKLHNMEQKVSLLGNRDDIPTLMAEADIFAMCSAWEGLPIALIEATLSGLPVIVTNVGGCAEIVRDIGNGVVVDEITAEAYGAKLHELVSDDSKLEQYRQNAESQSFKYTIDSAVNEHIRLYEQVM